MKTNKGMVLAAVIALAPCIAGAQAMVTERSISLNAALDAAKAGLERCRADGYKVTVTVLNRHARTAVVLSDDGVNPHTIENSMRKAYTALVSTRLPKTSGAEYRHWNPITARDLGQARRWRERTGEPMTGPARAAMNEDINSWLLAFAQLLH